MKIDTSLSGLEDAPDHARRLEGLGVDGAFTFEGPHEVFTPLILAAPATTSLELSTNVAIAFPRNPIQLAHQAYDLQLLSRGRFTLGLGSQIRAQVEREIDQPVGVGGSRLGRHHPRGEQPEDGCEQAEPTRHQVDVGPLGQH
ncbi:MAG TPA: LLM class flavin-dependent oxidoreductase, partial [Acidimicrobiales bacterium]|nr:LLM class flavin-dependent oxidoreductase [Acidimicrobiales bacterium]